MLTRYVGQSGDTKKACCSRYSATRPCAAGARCETAAAGDGWRTPWLSMGEAAACGALDEIGEALGDVDSALGKTFPPIQCVCGQSLGRRPGCEETSAAPGPNLTSESVPASWKVSQERVSSSDDDEVSCHSEQHVIQFRSIWFGHALFCRRRDWCRIYVHCQRS